MTESTRKGISAAVLKNIAVLTMTIDHVTAYLLKDYLYSQGIRDLYSNGWYFAGRVVGRIAFVLYAFMIAEGAIRTQNKVKYAARLFILAIISTVPHSYLTAKKPFDPNNMNIFFLLSLGLLLIYAYEWLRDNIENRALSIAARLAAAAAASFIALQFNFEYGMMGVLLILAFYIWRYNTSGMVISVILVMSVGYMLNTVLHSGAVRWVTNHSTDLLNAFIRTDRIQIFGLLALPFILLYNGNKGRQLPKLFYYLYYPVHLGIIALILYL